jgi:hypothetical protein
VAAPRFLLQETQPGPAEIQRIRPRASGHLGGRKAFPAHTDILEARHFIIFTNHKPITYAFQQKRGKCSPRQFNHLDFVAQFTTDI